MKQKIFLFFAILFIVSLASAADISTPSFCCEQSLEGGVCLNLEESQCDSSFQMASTSCESTSFCKLGTCYDSKEGICMENVPQKVCTERGGAWSEKKASELPQCQLGCCIISDQAAFVPLVRCKKLSTNFGIEMDYRPSVVSESECIALANFQDVGACVTYTATGVNTCKFTTRQECGAKDGVIALNVNKTIFEQELGKKFFKDILCSAEELNTDSARQATTGCYHGKVYWYDDKGNRENVYSSDKDASWNNGRVAEPDDVCERTGGSKDCGNCDYLLGSVCSEWSGLLGLGKPTYGDYFCKKTTCTDMDGKTRLNGESWCVYDIEPGRGYEKVGSRHFRQICIDGEVTTDPCADFRNQICIHSGISTSEGEFSTAACRVNRWSDCMSQTRKKDCENIDVRDCLWTENVSGLSFTSSSSSQGSSFSNSAATSGSFTNSAASSSSSGAADFASGVSAISQFGNVVSGSAITSLVGSGVGQWEIDYDILNKVTKFNKTEAEEGGLCVPLIPPGSKFWEDQGSCSMASAKCEVEITKKEYYDGLFAGLDADKKKEYIMEENDCLKQVQSKKNVYEPVTTWAKQVNAICTSIGDCGANININDKYTDDGYIWRFQNTSFSLLGDVTKGLSSKTTGNVVAQSPSSKVKINENLELSEDHYVLLKTGESKYQLVKVSELKVQDVIIDGDGNELKIETITFPGKVQEEFEYEQSKSLSQTIWEKIAGRSLPEQVVGEGNSQQGLSLGEYGTGIKTIKETQ